MNTRRIVKISTISLLSLIGLAIIGVILLLTLVNPNTFKPRISKAVYENTGRKLTIDGDISWKIWPNIGLKIEKLSLSNAEGFMPPNMLDVAAATVTIELMPLFQHNIIIDNIMVDGLNIGLIKKGGLNNWTFKPIKSAGTTTNETTANKPMQLELNKFILTHSTFSYTDMDKNKQYAIKDFAFGLETGYGGKISLDKSQEKIILNKVNFDFDKIINGNLNLSANNFNSMKYQGDMDIDKFSVTALARKLNYPIKVLEGNVLFNQVALNSKFSGDLNSIVLDGFKFNLSDVVKGLVNIKVNSFSDPVYSGDVNLDEFLANAALDKMGIAVAQRKGNQLLNKVTFQTRFSGTTHNLNLQQLHFNLSEILQGLINLKIYNFSKLAYSGDISLPTFSLNQAMAKSAMAPINIVNKQLLDKVSVQTNFNGTDNRISLSNLLGKISNSTFSGVVNAISIKPLNLTENIRLDKINLEDLAQANGYKIPLTGIAVNGNLTNSGVDLKNMSKVSANQNIMVDNITVLGFDLNNLFAQFDSALTNTGKAVTLENMQPLTHSAAVIQAVRNMQDIAAKAKGDGVKDYTKKTNFGQLQANLAMHNGIANSSTFKLNGPSIKSNGTGSVNMVGKLLNYTIEAQIVTPMKNPILNKLIFPYSIQGKFNNLGGYIDWLSIQKQMLEYLINQTVTQTKAIVNDQVNQQINTLKKNNPQLQQPLDNVKKGAGNILNNVFK